ncbi:unnamed protein product [Adineta ricciae]|uniref:ADP ribosyltransferase domain-containing protein n=2 Tax=Adineta ricciae TaxID=249248 RepID=A0A816DHU2_ADIRI|nr:unnamed protein product [Adineta ricciae]
MIRNESICSLADTVESHGTDASSDTTNKNILVWYDPNMSEHEEYYQRIIYALRQSNTVHQFLFYSNQDLCISYIQSESDENRIFMLISGLNADMMKLLLEKIYRLKRIDSIFLYVTNKEVLQRCQPLELDYYTVMGIYNQSTVLIKAVLRRLKTEYQLRVLRNPDRSCISVFISLAPVSPDDDPIGLTRFSCIGLEQNFTGYLRDCQSAYDYVWFQMFTILLERTPCNQQTRRIMTQCCRDLYRADDISLKQIDHFGRTYKADRALYWYTKPSFFNMVINSVLRSNNVGALYVFREQILDIRMGLAVKCKEQIKQWQRDGFRQRPLYRGTTMDQEKYQELQTHSIDHFISFYGFLSTTYEESVAQIFAASGDETLSAKNQVSVIFVITVPTLSEFDDDLVFANVSSVTAVSDEEEILFDIGTTFKVESTIYEPQNKTYYVRMLATSEGARAARRVMLENWVALCDLMVNRVNEWYDFARDGCKELLSKKDLKELPWNHVLQRIVYTNNLMTTTAAITRQNPFQALPSKSRALVKNADRGVLQRAWGYMKRHVFRTDPSVLYTPQPRNAAQAYHIRLQQDVQVINTMIDKFGM